MIGFAKTAMPPGGRRQQVNYLVALHAPEIFENYSSPKGKKKAPDMVGGRGSTRLD
jgi:hypothetical protein